MLFQVTFVLVFAGTALASRPLQGNKPNYDLKDAEKYFADFIETFGRQYKSTEEYNRRFEIFKRKLDKINHLNAVHDATFDITQFADKNHSEINFGFVPHKVSHNDTVEFKEEWFHDVPDKLDYRKLGMVSAVKDLRDGRLGYMFAAVDNIESMYAKQTGKLIPLSVQQAIECHTRDTKGDYPGYPISVMRAFIKSGGLMSEADYPRTTKVHKCRAKKDKVKVKVTAGRQLFFLKEESLKAALVKFGPLSISMYLSEEMLLYRGGRVYKPTDCGIDYPNYSFLLVGYDTDKDGTPYWIIKNSLSEYWGEKGYLLLEMGKRYCKMMVLGAQYAEVASP